MGVGAVFYVQVALPYFEGDVYYLNLLNHLKALVYAFALASIIVHGITVPLIMTSLKIGPTLISLSRSLSRGMLSTSDQADPVSRLPRYANPISRGQSSDDLQTTPTGSQRHSVAVSQDLRQTQNEVAPSLGMSTIKFANT